MWTIGLGLLGFILIMTGHVFETSGPSWLGFLCVVFGVILDLSTDSVEPTMTENSKDQGIIL